jgi:hypothetical protein
MLRHPHNLLRSPIHILHNEPHGLVVRPGFLNGNATRGWHFILLLNNLKAFYVTSVQ